MYSPTFPSTCLSPDQPGYGQIVRPGTGKRRAHHNLDNFSSANPRQDWTIISSGPSTRIDLACTQSTLVMSHNFHQPSSRFRDYDQHSDEADSPIMLHAPYVERPIVRPGNASVSEVCEPGSSRRMSPPMESGSNVRYSPYPSPLSSGHSSRRPPSYPSSESAELSSSASTRASQPIATPSDIILPPLRISNDGQSGQRRVSVTLPPISAMEGMHTRPSDSLAVLRRLQLDDDEKGSSYPPMTGDRHVSASRRHSVQYPTPRASEAVHPYRRSPSALPSHEAAASAPYAVDRSSDLSVTSHALGARYAQVPQYEQRDVRISPSSHTEQRRHSAASYSDTQYHTMHPAERPTWQH
ncbi:hypothetical protein OBBRIDRAFT_656917 [Obba rivulosa]|uniref:Uncharacterized protein n=1 Tax=Obba rivulosa TaxID=1052685 RepID=A0A8E2ARF2_9APHY|nr:hypothetical protein OBBRIDRAFT_656917 [Obba rivulosa]